MKKGILNYLNVNTIFQSSCVFHLSYSGCLIIFFHRLEELKAYLDTLAKLLSGIKDILSQIEEKVKSCKYPDILGDTGSKTLEIGKQILAKVLFCCTSYIADSTNSGILTLHLITVLVSRPIRLVQK